MTGVTRGARLWTIHESEVGAVVILDRGPEGWWVALEGKLDAKGRPVVEQVPARGLFPTKGAALGVLAANR